MGDRRITRMQGQTDCPYCGRPNNAHAGDGVMETGAWSCCYGCHKISRFIVPPGGPVTLRKATRLELVDFARDDPDLARVLAPNDEDVAAAVAALGP